MKTRKARAAEQKQQNSPRRLGGNRKRSFIDAFPPWRSGCSQRPGAVKGAPYLGAAKRTLEGEDRCDRIEQGGKELWSHLYSMEDNSEP